MVKYTRQTRSRVYRITISLSTALEERAAPLVSLEDAAPKTIVCFNHMTRSESESSGSLTGTCV